MLNALIVDDDEGFLTGLAEIARQEGFAVETAGSLKEDTGAPCPQSGGHRPRRPGIA
jgi:ActR/RegA family two-component response regulator